MENAKITGFDIQRLDVQQLSTFFRQYGVDQYNALWSVVGPVAAAFIARGLTHAEVVEYTRNTALAIFSDLAGIMSNNQLQLVRKAG